MEEKIVERRFKAIEQWQSETERELEKHTEILKEISTKQDEQEQQLTLIYTDVGHIKADIAVLKTNLGKLESRVERIESKVDEGFGGMEKRFDAIAEVQKLILERLPKRGEEEQ